MGVGEEQERGWSSNTSNCNAQFLFGNESEAANSLVGLRLGSGMGGSVGQFASGVYFRFCLSACHLPPLSLFLPDNNRKWHANITLSLAPKWCIARADDAGLLLQE